MSGLTRDVACTCLRAYPLEHSECRVKGGEQVVALKDASCEGMLGPAEPMEKIYDVVLTVLIGPDAVREKILDGVAAQASRQGREQLHHRVHPTPL